MIGPPAALLCLIVVVRTGLYWRQRRRLLRQHDQSGLRAVCDAGIDRARRLLRAELGRVFAAILLLLLIAFCIYQGNFGSYLVPSAAAAAYIAEVVIAAFPTVNGMRGKSGSLLVGTALAVIVALLSRLLIGNLAPPVWLLITSLLGIAAIAIHQCCEWLWLRPYREVRSSLGDEQLRSRLETLARQCGVADIQFLLIEGDTHTANARAESDPRGRRVVLWPALLQRLEPEELGSVITHELGHLALRHLLARFATTSVLAFIAAAISLLVAVQIWDRVETPASLHLATMAVLLPLILSCLRCCSLAIYRRQEIDADSFVCRQGKGAVLADALLKLSPLATAGPESDIWHHYAYDSHPSTAKRLMQLRAII